MANLSSCASPRCVKDWFATANPPLKAANQLPVAPMCGAGSVGQPAQANDSVMLYLRIRAPTNARAFQFNGYFFSVEYPEFVCTDYNDQLIALVDTPTGTPQPIPNPVDKNLMTHDAMGTHWPIGINIAHGTNLFRVCDAASMTANCSGTTVASTSCALGASDLTGTGFESDPLNPGCLQGGGTGWLKTVGNVIPGEVMELRIAIWDVGDHIYDSTALLDNFQWLAAPAAPGTD